MTPIPILMMKNVLLGFRGDWEFKWISGIWLCNEIVQARWADGPLQRRQRESIAHVLENGGTVLRRQQAFVIVKKNVQKIQNVKIFLGGMKCQFLVTNDWMFPSQSHIFWWVDWYKVKSETHQKIKKHALVSSAGWYCFGNYIEFKYQQMLYSAKRFSPSFATNIVCRLWDYST